MARKNSSLINVDGLCSVLILPLVDYYVCTDSTIMHHILCQSYRNAMKKREIVWGHSVCYVNVKSVVKRLKALMRFWYWHTYRRNFRDFLTRYKNILNSLIVQKLKYIRLKYSGMANEFLVWWIRNFHMTITESLWCFLCSYRSKIKVRYRAI